MQVIITRVLRVRNMDHASIMVVVKYSSVVVALLQSTYSRYHLEDEYNLHIIDIFPLKIGHSHVTLLTTVL